MKNIKPLAQAELTLMLQHVKFQADIEVKAFAADGTLIRLYALVKRLLVMVQCTLCCELLPAFLAHQLPLLPVPHHVLRVRTFRGEMLRAQCAIKRLSAMGACSVFGTLGELAEGLATDGADEIMLGSGVIIQLLLRKKLHAADAAHQQVFVASFVHHTEMLTNLATCGEHLLCTAILRAGECAIMASQVFRELFLAGEGTLTLGARIR